MGAAEARPAGALEDGPGPLWAGHGDLQRHQETGFHASTSHSRPGPAREEGRAGPRSFGGRRNVDDCLGEVLRSLLGHVVANVLENPV
jgi:hypothetical protein